jgi:conjugative transfer signal peptidase TraF
MATLSAGIDPLLSQSQRNGPYTQPAEAPGILATQAASSRNRWARINRNAGRQLIGTGGRHHSGIGGRLAPESANASASVPIGLYRIEKHPAKRDEIAVLQLPEWAALIASERHYLPRNAWLMKLVVALHGEIICRFGVHVFVDGKLIAQALAADKMHRPMPSWRGCRRLSLDQFFLLSRHRDSFDSRYFGTVDGALVAGTAKPILIVRR